MMDGVNASVIKAKQVERDSCADQIWECEEYPPKRTQQRIRPENSSGLRRVKLE